MYSAAQRKAAAINRKINLAYPYATHGRSYHLRDQPGSFSMNEYGPTHRLASAAQKAARARDGYVGRGRYMGGRGRYMGGRGSYGQKVLNTLGKELKSSAMYLRRMGGDDVVRSALGSAARMVGRGAYMGDSTTVRNGLAVGGTTSAPVFGPGGDDMGGVMLTHCEYLTDIYGNDGVTTFDNTPFSINPGLERTFPWLAQTAANFDEYEFVQLMFEFRSTISDAPNTNGQVGTIVMATNYNVTASPFVDKGTMMQYGGATASKVTDNVQHFVECDPAQLSGAPGKYVRNAPTLVSQDPKTYDLGLFQIAVSGTPTTFADQPIGELWVHYKIRLRKPKLYSASGNAISKDVFASSSDRTSTITAGGGGLSFQLFDTTLLLRGQQNSIGILLTQATNAAGASVTRLTFPAMTVGAYEIIVYANLLGSVSGAPQNQQFFFSPVARTAAGVTSALALIPDLPIDPSPPAAPRSSSKAQASIGATYLNYNQQWIIHVQASPQYGAQFKDLDLQFDSAAAGGGTAATLVAISALFLTVTEYNPMQSPNTVPLLINSAGAITLPA